MSISKVIAALALSATFTGFAAAAPVVDGHFDSSEGYTDGHMVTFDVQGGASGVGGGELWTYQDPTTHNVYVAFLQSLDVVDNSYGTTQVGWGTNAPSGKSHKFSDLTGSDSGTFTIKNGSGASVLGIQLDYFTNPAHGSTTYASLGISGGDGKLLSGSGANLLDAKTSMDYNFNTLGYSSFTTNSPSTGSSTMYADPASAPGWDFYVTYEFEISASALSAADNYAFSILPGLMHDSPNKIAKNDVTPHVDGMIPPPTPSIPAPAAMPAGLVLLGIMAAARRRNAHA